MLSARCIMSFTHLLQHVDMPNAKVNWQLAAHGPRHQPPCSMQIEAFKGQPGVSEAEPPPKIEPSQ
jgi:hypothetical protein